MARTPPWGLDLSRAGRAVAAHGLVSGAAPPERPLAEEDWSGLVHECGRHRTDGLLVAAVASGAFPVSDAQRAQAAELEVALTTVRMVHDHLLAEVTDHLDGVGIEVRVLKGPALAHLDYPDPQWRPTGDIDLLVRPADIDRASEALVRRGGHRLDPDPRPGYAAVVGKGATVSLDVGVEVDLHRLLVWGPFGVRLDPSLLWEGHRRFVLVDGTTCATLPPEETLVHACCHLLVLGRRRAVSARDVGQLLASSSLDVDRALRVARALGVEAVLSAGILLAERELALLDVGELGGWARGFVPRRRDRLWLRVERPEDPIGPLEPVATAIELPTRSARRMFAAATARPAEGTITGPADRLRRVLSRVADGRPARRRR